MRGFGHAECKLGSKCKTNIRRKGEQMKERESPKVSLDEVDEFLKKKFNEPKAIYKSVYSHDRSNGWFKWIQKGIVNGVGANWF